MIRKVTGPNGTAIVRDGAHISDDDVVDRAMQAGRSDVGSIVAKRNELSKHYTIEHDYTLTESKVEDIAFTVGEDIADQHGLPFDGIAVRQQGPYVVFYLGFENYYLHGFTGSREMHKALADRLRARGRI